MYTAKYLLSALNGSSSSSPSSSSSESGGGLSSLPSVRIDVLERLPTPFGLVRSGVAPDHPEVKNVERDFERLFEQEEDDSNAAPPSAAGSEEKGASGGGGRGRNGEGPLAYRGNVRVGRDVTLDELRGLYDAVILAYGCENDAELGIDGEDTLRGVLSAREFVAWYNGHPDFVRVGETVADALGGDGGGDGDGRDVRDAKVVVIGQGNVALDCARILTKGGSGLSSTDAASHALPVLGDGVRSVTVLGRRGHVQGAYTIKELRELTKLEKGGYDSRFIITGDDLDAGLTEASREELTGPGARPRVRIDKLLRDQANASSAAAATTTSSSSSEGPSDDSIEKKEVRLRFLLRPRAFLPRSDDPSKLGGVSCERTRLAGEAGRQGAVGTGETEEFDADLALVSIGYKGSPLPGMEDEDETEEDEGAGSSSRGVFDSDRGVVRNFHGAVIRGGGGGGSSEAASTPPEKIEGLYASGWLKRGPSGIIGTNIPDAKDTVASILRDLKSGSLVPGRERVEEGDDTGDGDDGGDDDGRGGRGAPRGREGLDELLRSRGVTAVDWEGYRRIDDAERRRAKGGSNHPDKPREKFTNVEDMMRAASEVEEEE